MAGTSGALTYKEALSMVGQPYTCFKAVKSRKHITLSPAYIGKVAEGIHEAISSDLKIYCDMLDGIPIAYDRPKCVQRFGLMMNENPYMHFDVEVNYIVFQPKVGSILCGRVNKLGEDHVGCLVHGTFNASIHKPQDKSYWIGSQLSGGEDFEFEVTRLHTRSGIVSIHGKIPEASSIAKGKSGKKQKGKKVNNIFSEENNSDSLLNSSVLEECNSSRKRKHGDTLNNNDEDMSQDLDNSIKRRKKEKVDAASLGQLINLNSEVQDSTSSSSQTKVKRKKKKSTDQDILIKSSLESTNSLVKEIKTEEFASSQESNKKKKKKKHKEQKKLDDLDDTGKASINSEVATNKIEEEALSSKKKKKQKKEKREKSEGSSMVLSNDEVTSEEMLSQDAKNSNNSGKQFHISLDSGIDVASPSIFNNSLGSLSDSASKVHKKKKSHKKSK